MFENDYFMRIIDKMAEVVQKAITHRTNHEYPQSHEEINNGFQLLGVSRKLALMLPPKELLRFSGKAGLSKEKSGYLMAELLKQDAEVYADEGNIRAAKGQCSAALDILNELQESDCCEHLEKIQTKADEISKFNDEIK